MSAPSIRLPQHGSERLAALRALLALGLTLLLMVGAWSSAHGTVEAHSALCTAPGSSASAPDQEVSGTAVTTTTDSGPVALAMICCFLLVMILLRLVGSRGRLLISAAARTTAPIRAGPALLTHTLTPSELSVSRT